MNHESDASHGSNQRQYCFAHTYCFHNYEQIQDSSVTEMTGIPI